MIIIIIIIYYDSDDDDNIVDLTAESPPRKRVKGCEGNKDLKQSKIVMHTTQVGSQKSTSLTPADKVNITTIESGFIILVLISLLTGNHQTRTSASRVRDYVKSKCTVLHI